MPFDLVPPRLRCRLDEPTLQNGSRVIASRGNMFLIAEPINDTILFCFSEINGGYNALGGLSGDYKVVLDFGGYNATKTESNALPFGPARTTSATVAPDPNQFQWDSDCEPPRSNMMIKNMRHYELGSLMNHDPITLANS